jgi:ABC-type nitrate/sulfonate/bicarbonate transport system permease component
MSVERRVTRRRVPGAVGLGFYVLYASSRMETAMIFAALFVLCLIGLALFGAIASPSSWCAAPMEGRD